MSQLRIFLFLTAIAVCTIWSTAGDRARVKAGEYAVTGPCTYKNRTVYLIEGEETLENEKQRKVAEDFNDTTREAADAVSNEAKDASGQRNHYSLDAKE